jgi:hypothetical protein
MWVLYSKELLLTSDLCRGCRDLHNMEVGISTTCNQCLLPLTLWVFLWSVRFNTNFNNISVISMQSVLLVEETGVLRENHRPVSQVTDKLYHLIVVNPTTIRSRPQRPHRMYYTSVCKTYSFWNFKWPRTCMHVLWHLHGIYRYIGQNFPCYVFACLVLGKLPVMWQSNYVIIKHVYQSN